ncbi:MerR family transcriptional regulator [Paenibacillus donghaensis]|uniref:MerR family transcriptional regulator n=1 Tax=Paenibacillus donghaensis TaxID=414771 RepID=UPI001883D12C|nr:MerR family transcriptional regulator [Paenibacillus donghaensis]MBE9916424.1 MerR family transcriptional regulator [Paenibacillus donghaensis]
MMVKEVAELSGISVRTLHHYDEIGLLHPSRTTEAGYRVYSDEDIALLQQILFFRELGFPLKQIREIINRPDFDRLEAMELHHRLLLDKRARLERMIETLEQTMKHEKGEISMTNHDKFAGFDFGSNPYEQEARERWGDKAVAESNEKLNKLSKREQGDLEKEMNAIYRKLADLRHGSPSTEEAQLAVGEWYQLLNRLGSYSLEAFKGLGQMYAEDERFTRNIDRFGAGLAVFMRDAMTEYVDSRQS